MKMEVMFCSTMLVTIYKTTQYYNTEHSPDFHCHENINSCGTGETAPLLSCFIGGEEFVCCHH
jgi:hypothetical protein